MKNVRVTEMYVTICYNVSLQLVRKSNVLCSEFGMHLILFMFSMKAEAKILFRHLHTENGNVW